MLFKHCVVLWSFFLYFLLSFQFLRQRVVRPPGNVGTVINPEFRGWQRTWIVCESAPRLPMLEVTKDKVDHLVDRHEDELLQLEEVLDRVIIKYIEKISAIFFDSGFLQKNEKFE